MIGQSEVMEALQDNKWHTSLELIEYLESNIGTIQTSLRKLYGHNLVLRKQVKRPVGYGRMYAYKIK